MGGMEGGMGDEIRKKSLRDKLRNLLFNQAQDLSNDELADTPKGGSGSGTGFTGERFEDGIDPTKKLPVADKYKNKKKK